MITILEQGLKEIEKTINDSKTPVKYRNKAKRDYKNLKKDLDLLYQAYHKLYKREEKLIDKYNLNYLL